MLMAGPSPHLHADTLDVQLLKQVGNAPKLRKSHLRLTALYRMVDVQARLRVGARLQHLQSERSALVAKLQALSDPQDVEMYEQV